MAESLANSADTSNKDKRPNSGSSEGAKDNSIDDMAEWERRLVEGDLPDDFLEVTEPQNQGNETKSAEAKKPTSGAATGLLVDIPTVTSSNSVPQEPPPEDPGILIKALKRSGI